MSRAITAEDLWRLPRVGTAVPAGPERLVIPVTTYDMDSNRGRSRLWLIDPEGGRRPLTAEEEDCKKPAVSPDLAHVAFLGRVGEHFQLRMVPLSGGEAETVTELPLGVLGARWHPDGASLFVLAYLLDGHLDPDATSAELERRHRAKLRVYSTEHVVYRYWDTWLTTGEVPHLFRLDPASRTIADLTPDSRRWWQWPSTDDPSADFDISPDGTEVAFSADRSEPPHPRLHWAVYLLDLRTGAHRMITEEATSHCTRPRYSPDGRTLVYGMQVIPDFYGDRVRLVAYDRATGSHRVLTESWDRSAASWEFDGRGDLIFVAEDQGRQHLFRVGLGGGEPERLATGGTIDDPVVTSGGTVYVTHHSLTQPHEIHRLGEGGRLLPVTEFTAETLAGIELGKADEIFVTGADGDSIQCHLLLPPGFDPAERWPLVHLIHGGPHAISGDAWHWRWNAQCLAASGCVVAMANFHGSTSFGTAFTTSIQGSWGDQPYRDIEAVTDHLIGTGCIDEERMAVTGGSYGGYLTAFITSQTDRYACAVAHAAVTNLAGMYASDVTSGRSLAYGAEIWEDRAKVDRFSPSSHAAGYRTPTLVVHGERDFRVPLTQGLELYGVLRAKGVPARLVYYPEESHWVLSPQASVHWYGEVLEWLNLYLKLRPYARGSA